MTVTQDDLLVGPVTPVNGTTLISVDFYFEAASNLEVYKTGSETPLTLNTDYTVSTPSSVGATDGSITLAVAANGTDSYSIFGVQALARSSDLQFRGDLRSPVLNVELDRIYRALQSLQTLATRTINLAKTAPDLPPITFTAGGTDGRAIVFNSDSSALVPGATADEIAGAQAAATAAAASAAAAAVDASTASGAADTVAPILPITTDIESVAAISTEVQQVAAIDGDIVAIVTGGAVTLSGLVVTGDVDFTGTGAVRVPVGTTAQRPGAPVTGDIRFNTTTGKFESYDGSVWGGLGEIADSADTDLANDPDAALRRDIAAAKLAEVDRVRAWVNFNGTGTVAIRASENVSSITDNGTGYYTVNFTTALADADYAMVSGSTIATDGTKGLVTLNGGFNTTVSGKTASACEIKTGGANLNLVDFEEVHVAFIR